MNLYGLQQYLSSSASSFKMWVALGHVDVESNLQPYDMISDIIVVIPIKRERIM